VENMGFILERSEAADTGFIEIASYESCPDLKGQGNSSEVTRYSFTDFSVFNDQIYWYRLSDVDFDGLRTSYPAISAIPGAAVIPVDPPADNRSPEVYELMQNYPNPFNPVTGIGFSLPREDHIILTVYDITGKEVCLLYDGLLSAGYYRVFWNGSDHHGIPAAAGVYIYTFTSINYFRARKMVLLN
jgi:hypothetical protein